jgi:hypothetical protein
VADGQDRPRDLVDEAGDIGRVVGDAAQRVRGRGHLDPGRLEALDDAVPAGGVGEGAVDEHHGERAMVGGCRWHETSSEGRLDDGVANAAGLAGKVGADATLDHPVPIGT